MGYKYYRSLGTQGLVRFYPRFVLRLYTVGSAWCSSENGKKGAIVAGQLADLAVLSDDFFSVPDERIKQLGPIVAHTAEELTRKLGGRWPHPH